VVGSLVVLPFDDNGRSAPPAFRVERLAFSDLDVSLSVPSFDELS
jgi:hypothetical protein